MKQNLILLLFLLPAITAIGQADTTAPDKKRSYTIATFYTMDGIKTKGWFYKMDSNNVYLLPPHKETLQDVDLKNPDVKKGSFSIEAVQINTIEFKKKNAALKGALIGLGTGILVGGIIGFIGNSDPNISHGGGIWQSGPAMPVEEKKTSWVLVGGVTGTVAGVIIGAFAKKKFTIGGKKEVYRDLKSDLMQQLIIK